MGLEGKRIFVLEDDVTNLAIISAILRRGGAEIFFDTWGKETLSVLLKFLPIHAILLDLNLPNNVSGFDVYDQIHARPELGNIPVIAVTATDPSIGMKKAREKGFNGYITKPIRTKTFVKAMSDILAGQEVWGIR